MSISAALVKELRERTGAGMMECKKALVATEGNIEAAIENMRKSGQAKAAKKAGRIAAEGMIAASTSADQQTAVILEVNCETDFVARDEHFKLFVNTVAERALAEKAADLAAITALPYQAGEAQTVEDTRKELISKLGENIQLRRVELIEGTSPISTYVHGGRIGVLVQLDKEAAEIGRDIAMHIAASNPQALSEEDVPKALVEKEKEIFTAQAQSSGKPANIIDKMIAGRIKKFLSEVSLLGQPFVKEPSQTVGDVTKSHQVQVQRFIRFAVGEGIEKKEENFADEVMAQVRGGE